MDLTLNSTQKTCTEWTTAQVPDWSLDVTPTEQTQVAQERLRQLNRFCSHDQQKEG